MIPLLHFRQTICKNMNGARSENSPWMNIHKVHVCLHILELQDWFVHFSNELLKTLGQL
jgi:hypothetical protein